MGLEIDAAAQRIRIPPAKLEKLQSQLQEALTCEKLTLRQLQSIIGSLNFVYKAVAPGRAFLRRLIDLTKGARRPHHRVRITAGAKADLRAWSIFLSEFNGNVMFMDFEWHSNSHFQFYTDSAGSVGFGIYFAGKWAQGRWPDTVLARKYSIALLELFPIVVGLQIWGSQLANSRVLFWSDNQTVVQVVNKQTSKCREIMKLVRRLVVVCLQYNIQFKARYVPEAHNNIADSLSRFQMDRFARLAPEADLNGHALPAHLWESFA